MLLLGFSAICNIKSQICVQKSTPDTIFHAWGLKKMYGKEYEGIMRISYLVNANGIIEKVYSKVKTATHAMDVIESLDE